jgi:hypothetical protein
MLLVLPVVALCMVWCWDVAGGVACVMPWGSMSNHSFVWLVGYYSGSTSHRGIVWSYFWALPEKAAHLFLANRDLVFRAAPAETLHHHRQPHGVSRRLIRGRDFQHIAQQIAAADAFLFIARSKHAIDVVNNSSQLIAART